MGVYIKNFKRPASCWSCDMPLSALKCPVQTEEEAMRYCSCRHKDCPLVPVPPHGRLIDADALEYEEAYLNGHYELGDVEIVTREDIESAPTIIPASEEGE